MNIINIYIIDKLAELNDLVGVYLMEIFDCNFSSQFNFIFRFSDSPATYQSHIMALLLRYINLQTRQSLCLLRHISSTTTCNFPKAVAKSEGRKDIGEAKPLGEKMKEGAKTTSYMGVIVIGVGVTVVMFGAILKELFSSNSPVAIYSDAFDKCKVDPRVQDALGMPVKCYGEESRRGRRNHVAHQIYQKNNRNYMRLTFHIQGLRNKATVHCEMREVSANFCTLEHQ